MCFEFRQSGVRSYSHNHPAGTSSMAESTFERPGAGGRKEEEGRGSSPLSSLLHPGVRFYLFNIIDSTVLEFDSHENRILCLKKKKFENHQIRL